MAVEGPNKLALHFPIFIFIRMFINFLIGGLRDDK